MRDETHGVTSIAFFKNDKLNGPYTRYLNGKISETVEYINDKQEGERIKYSPEGNILSRTLFVDGQRM
jgi:antitoxin component YwqK of YwqJK toxin-antitoxin module